MNWGLVAPLLIAALVLLASGALTRGAGLVSVGLTALAGAYAVALPDVHGVAGPVSAALLAPGLLVCGEVGFSLAGRGTAPMAKLRHRARWLAACGLGAFVAAVLVLLAATVPVGRSLPMTIAGTVAAVAAVGLLSLSAARRSRPEAAAGAGGPGGDAPVAPNQ